MNLKIGGFIGGFMITILVMLHKEVSQFWLKYVRLYQGQYSKNQETNIKLLKTNYSVGKYYCLRYIHLKAVCYGENI